MISTDNHLVRVVPGAGRRSKALWSKRRHRHPPPSPCPPTHNANEQKTNQKGVWEKDEVRKDDSFDAFEEVLQLAVAYGADLVLLGGDLFHDNKPSRPTIVRAMRLLKRYCLGDRPVAVNVLSDQAANFVAGCVVWGWRRVCVAACRL